VRIVVRLEQETNDRGGLDDSCLKIMLQLYIFPQEMLSSMLSVRQLSGKVWNPMAWQRSNERSKPE
jgi:hypothetical protein